MEKILRIQETAARLRIPLFYLVDSAGARITDQIDMFPGRRHAGRIFFNEVRLSGRVPQICLLFGPSAAGGAYIPAFCDVVIMVEGNASMYLGSPRMVEVVVGEKVTLESLGGARMHCTESGCGDFLVPDDGAAIALGRRYLSYFPQRHDEAPPAAAPGPARPGRSIVEIIPQEPGRGYDMHRVIDRIVDEGSWLEVKELVRSRDPPWPGPPRRGGGRRGREPAAAHVVACCSSTARTRRRVSSGCATPSRSRFSSWPTCRAS